MDLQQTKIAIIGLGYVGLPLAVEFGKKYPTVGFDINQARIAELNGGKDSTLEVEPELLAETTHLSFTHELQGIANSNVYIVTVPTPIDSAKRPDLTPLETASAAIGSVLKKGDTVVYESTVYPGCTEEVCIPILEKTSGLKFNQDFYAGYSPERINPGDKEHRVTTIMKVTSGSTPEVADYVDALYGSIITAGTHKAPTIKVAEASKVIENTQRDANIALMNEFAMIFDRLGIDTNDVLEAAGTKWNFLPFRPGLVGGHCIGVDPYYLIQKAQSVDYYPDILIAARRINDGMGEYVAEQVIKLMLYRGINPVGARILVLGLAFKESCPDIRNSRVVDVINGLSAFNARVDVYDPWVDPAEASREYGLELLLEDPAVNTYDALVLAVAHDQFKDGTRLKRWAKERSITFDIKSVLDRSDVDGRL